VFIETPFKISWQFSDFSTQPEKGSPLGSAFYPIGSSLRPREVRLEPEILNAMSMKKIRKRTQRKTHRRRVPQYFYRDLNNLLGCANSSVILFDIQKTQAWHRALEYFLRDAQLLLHMLVDGLHLIDF
jgi:hypothetical protein